MIDDYFRSVQALLSALPVVRNFNMSFDRRSDYVGFVRGVVYFADDSALHIREFINTQEGIQRFTYAYHYQRSSATLIFRYDDAPHYPELTGFPHHKHDGSETNVVATSPPDLAAVFDEIERLIGLS